MKNEPLVTLASITAGVTALLALLVAFGIPITQEQQVAILGVVAVVAPFVVAIAGRAQVTPNGSVVERVDQTGTVLAGEANELPTDTTIRTLGETSPENEPSSADPVEITDEPES